MAVAYSEFRNLIGRIDNDNRPGFFAVKSSLPTRLPNIRTDTLELEYANLATRLEPETGMLWAHFLHRERACFTADLLADLRHFQEWLRDSFGDCDARGDAVPASGLGLAVAQRLEHGRQPRQLHQPDPRPGRGRRCAPTPTAASTSSTTTIAPSTCRS